MLNQTKAVGCAGLEKCGGRADQLISTGFPAEFEPP